jgi:hypothetical protein
MLTLIRFAVLLAAALLTLRAQTVPIPGNWIEFKGTHFSFRYPPDWRVSQPITPELSGVRGSNIDFKVAYIANSDGDLDRFLMSDMQSLRQSAATAGGSIRFDEIIPSVRGGRSYLAEYTPRGSQPTNVWTAAVPFGKAIYAFRFQYTNYFEIEQYRTPLVASVRFARPQEVFTGSWKAQSVTSDLSPRTYRVDLNVSSSGTYALTIEQVQARAPLYRLQVEGRYETTYTDSNDDTGVRVAYKPTAYRLSQNSGGAVTLEQELPSIRASGIPALDGEPYRIMRALADEVWIRRAGASGWGPIPEIGLARTSGAGQPGIQVLNAASFEAGPVAPGSLFSIFGVRTVMTDEVARSLPLPLNLGGVTVALNGRPCPLLYVGQNQINAQVPFEIGRGSASLTVTYNGVAVASGSVTVTSTAPGIFVDSSKRAIAANQNFTLNSRANPARPGSYIVVYFTGQGVYRPRGICS